MDQAPQSFARFLSELLGTVFTKTLESFGQNSESFLVAVFCFVFGGLGAAWAWFSRARRDGVMTTIPDRSKVRTALIGALAGCVPLVLVFAFNAVRVVRDREGALRTQVGQLTLERDKANTAKLVADNARDNLAGEVRDLRSGRDVLQKRVGALENRLGIMTALRPSFLLKNSRIEPVFDPNDPTKRLYHRVVLPLTQTEDHTATGVTGWLLILDTNLKPNVAPILKNPIESVNDVPKGGPLRIVSPPLTLKPNMRGAFVVLVLWYRDRVTGLEAAGQAWFQVWRGVDGKGVFERSFFSVTPQQKNDIQSYIRATLLDVRLPL